MSHHALAGRKGGNTTWSRIVDRAAHLERAQSKSPNSVDYHLARLDPAFDDATVEQCHAAAESARKAYMADLALRSAAARRKRTVA